ncbi:MAG: hypothetical protein JWN70_6545 [Planctomycetaceae bacterium]|nr:hypothetical protein [Planctomycetaceae bacterium]
MQVAILPKRHISGIFVQLQDKQATNSYKRNRILVNSVRANSFSFAALSMRRQISVRQLVPAGRGRESNLGASRVLRNHLPFRPTQLVREPEDASQTGRAEPIYRGAFDDVGPQ